MRDAALRVDRALLFCEEAAEDEHLADANDENDDRLADRPVLDPLVEVLGEATPLGLAQLVVGLVIDDHFQGLVDGYGRRLHLGIENEKINHSLTDG